MIERRAFVLGAAATAALPTRGNPQGSARAQVIWFTIAPVDVRGSLLARELERRGRERGVEIDLRGMNAGGRIDSLAATAAEVVRAKPQAAVVFAQLPTRALQRATTNIPIVAVGELLQEGLIESLSKPGGNTTGVNLPTRDLDIKNMELLAEMLPAAPLGMLNFVAARQPEALRALALKQNRDIQQLDVTSTDDFDAAFEKFRAQGVRAVVAANTSYFSQVRDDLIASAARHRIGLFCEWPNMAQAGCLASYGFMAEEFIEIVADYVVRILTGSKPHLLPVVEPTRFQLVVNQRVARALGLSLAPSVVGRADELIE